MARERCSACGGSGIFGEYSRGQKCGHCYGTGTVHVPDKWPGTSSSGPGASNRTCFPAGTRVRTPCGFRDIADLRSGDVVVSLNCKSGKLSHQKVVRLIRFPSGRLWRLRLVDGTEIRTTGHHSFRVENRWKTAQSIQPGDEIETVGMHLTTAVKLVECSEEVGEVAPVYNIVVDGHFNFIAEGGVAHSFTFARTLRSIVWSTRIAGASIIRSMLESTRKLASARTWRCTIDTFSGSR